MQQVKKCCLDRQTVIEYNKVFRETCPDQDLDWLQTAVKGELMKNPCNIKNQAAGLSQAVARLRKDPDCIEKTTKHLEQLRRQIAENAVHENYIVCLECGQKLFEINEEHLALHNLTSAEYKAIYGYDQASLLQCRAISKIETLLSLKPSEKR